MLKALTKTIVIASLLMLAGGQIVRADVKNYQYDGKLPFVQMMLNMMTAMGILDRVPANGRYGSSGYPASPWSSYSNPYARAMALRGLSPGSSSSFLQNPYMQNLYGDNLNPAYGNNPFLSSPWLQSPWSQPGLNAASPIWGSPSWGVLPLPGYSSDDLSGWVNEPWEASEWNPEAEKSTQSSHSSTASSQNNNVPAEVHQPEQAKQNRIQKKSPLSKLAPRGYSSGRPENESFSRPSNKPLNKKRKEKPCITDFCGLKKPNLNGLWVAQDGEMLGIKNGRFLWSDSKSRHLTGQIKIQNEYLLTSVDDHDKIIRFKYKLAGDYLLTLQPDGEVREFTRMPVNQYNSGYQGYDQGYNQSYDQGYYP